MIVSVTVVIPASNGDRLARFRRSAAPNGHGDGEEEPNECNALHARVLRASRPSHKCLAGTLKRRRSGVRGLAHRTDEDYLLIPHKELSPSLLERNPVRRVSTLSFEEQVELLFKGVVLFDRYRIILSVHQRDFEVHANGH
jgi:hypothetical protein